MFSDRVVDQKISDPKTPLVFCVELENCKIKLTCGHRARRLNGLTKRGFVKVLQKKVDAFKCESRTWVKSLRDFDESLKSIGDFENYVMTLENELKGIAEELKKRKEQ